MPDEPRIEVLVADDVPAFRAGIRALLTATSDTRLAGEASNGREAVALAERLQPDVVLMDLHMPGVNGITATRRILRTSPHIAVLVLTMFDDDASVFQAMQAGARGYLVKGASKAEILGAIRDVAGGSAIFGPAIARRMVSYFDQLRVSAGSYAFPELTAKETEVLRLIAQHLSNAEIARRLGISEKTIRNRCSTIYNKLQVADRSEAAARAREAGLGSGLE